jgi:5,10-methylenetetrahydromethanopterin reductase
MGSIGVLLPRDLPAADLVGYIRRAEALGFDEVWTVEDCFYRGGIAQSAIALASTSTISVGIGILPAALRSAALAAMEVGTLAEVFPGRVQVGIGHGMPQWMRQVGVWPGSPLTLLEEYFDAVRGILQGQAVSAAGRYVQLDEVTLDLAAGWVPPLLAGVRGPKSLALAGRVADGSILAEPVTPEYLAAAREQIAATRPHLIVAYNCAAVDDDSATARQVVRDGLHSIGEPDWAPHIAPLPFAADLARLRADCADGAEFAARMPDEWVDQLSVSGTPAQARDRIEQLFAAGATSVVLIPVGPDSSAALESLARVL